MSSLALGDAWAAVAAAYARFFGPIAGDQQRTRMPRSNAIRFRMPPIEGLTQTQDQDEDPRATYRWVQRAVELGYFSSVITGIYSQRHRIATHETSLGADIALLVAFVMGVWTLAGSMGLGYYGSVFEPEFPRRERRYTLHGLPVVIMQPNNPVVRRRLNHNFVNL